MSERNPFQNDPWDPDSYETGSTHPPKNRRGAVTVLLTLVIFLGGISSALGVMNVRLFNRLSESGNSAMTFTGDSPDSSGSVTDPTQATATAPKAENLHLELNPVPADSKNPSQENGLSYQEIYEKAIPSVASITCQLSAGTSGGTGVILSADGYIVTNCHVVEGARSIQVRLSDDRELEAWVVGADAVSDLAVLYVQAEDLTPAEFGDSAQIRVGDAVAAIGDPLGSEFRGTMTDGIISAINRDVTVDGRSMTLIQTNAALNSGNSGGPLLNCYGQVIGINTMKLANGAEGIGFAIPSVTVKEVVEQLLQQGYVSGRASLQLQGDTVSSFDQRFNRLPAGFLVSGVEEGGCAEEAGIAAGDILTHIGDVRVESAEDLTSALYNYAAGDTVQITLYRYRSSSQFIVTLILAEAVG